MKMKAFYLIFGLLISEAFAQGRFRFGRRRFGGRPPRGGQCPSTRGRVGVCGSPTADICRRFPVDTCRRSGRVCCPMACGQTVCMPPMGGGGGGGGGIPGCPPGSPIMRCFANPCTVLSCPRFPMARCINDNQCERACSGNFYLFGRRIPQNMCNARG